MTDPRTRSIDAAYSEVVVLQRLGVEQDPVVVAGRYEIVRRIASGGHGTVYEALDLELERRVAIKVLDPEDPQIARREGQLVARLEHPHIVRIWDHGAGSDYRYFVLELLDGPTLREWCDGLSQAQIIEAFAQCGQGLAALHRAGLVHRDFKPSNVRIGNGRAVLVDFGLARHQDTLERDPAERGLLTGTMTYLAPERLRGEVGDARSDQFSFCVALWELLSGENPFGPCTADTTPDERHDAIDLGVRRWPAGVRRPSASVLSVMRRGLELRMGDRWSSMDELLAELTRPRLSRLGGYDLLLVGLVLALVGTVASLVMPWRRGEGTGSIASSVLRMTAAPRAISIAGAGDVRGALRALERAADVELDPTDLRRLAMAAQVIARRLESAGDFEDAVVAWALSIRLARGARDRDLEQLGHDRLYSAAAELATAAPR